MTDFVRSFLVQKVDLSVCRMMWDTLDALNIQTWLGPAKDYFRALTVSPLLLK
jgi:hypothetical protein